MSKIYIEEVDLTTVEGQASEGTDVVYIPGFSSLSNVVGGAKVGVPTLCRTVSEFVNNFGSAPAIFAEDQNYPTEFSSEAIPMVGGSTPLKMFYAGDPDPSYIYAKELLALGLPVVYERVNTFSSLEDAGSIEAYDVTVQKMYTFLSSNFVARASVSATTDIEGATASVVNQNNFLSSYPDGGNYVFTSTTTATATTNIAGGSATVDVNKFVEAYDGRYKQAASYIFTAVLSNIQCQGTTSISGGTVSVDAAVFRTNYGAAGTYVFTYASNAWKDPSNTSVTLSDIGITLTGTPTASSTITVVVSYDVSWEDSNHIAVVLIRLGVILTGTPVANSTVTVTVAPISYTGQVWIDVKGNTISLASVGLSLALGSQSVVAGDTVSVSVNYVDSILLDRSLYNIKYITSGGYPTFEYNGKSVSQAMANLAKNRGDAVALIDHTNNPYRDLLGVSSVYYRANTSAYLLSYATQSYSAMFTPYCNYALINDYASISNGTYDLPPSFAYLSCLASSIVSNPSWLAIAGAARGKVSGLNSVNTNSLITNSIADSYQKDTAACINPITNIRPYGQCIWGNRTLVDNSVKQGTTALSFLNIRNLVCDIKKQIYVACQSLLFEQNSDILWVNFLSMVTPLLDQMVSGYGISNYKIIKLSPSDKSVITAEIRIYPVYAVEAFSITLYLQNGDVQVEE